MRQFWICKVGFAEELPQGADFPLRMAVARAYKEITGKDAEFMFSGWGNYVGDLTENELAAIENREPKP